MNRVLRIATMLAAAGCAPPVTERVLRVREDGSVDDDLEPGVYTDPGGRVIVVDPGPTARPPMPTREAIGALRVFPRSEDKARFLDPLAHLERRRPDPMPFVSMVRDELASARARRRYPDRYGVDRPVKDRSKAKAARKARKKNRGR